MPRYTDRYDALEAGRDRRRTTTHQGRRSSRKSRIPSSDRVSRSSASSSPLFYALCLIVIVLLTVVGVAGAHIVTTQRAGAGGTQRCAGWETCNFYEDARVKGLHERANWDPLSANAPVLETAGRPALFDQLLEYKAAQVPVTAHIDFRKGTAFEENVKKSGLTSGHEYSVLDTQLLKTRSGKILRLVQLRNPQARGVWNGEWATDSKEWQQYPEVKAYLSQRGFVPVREGVFWMPFEEFAKYFDKVTALGRSMPELMDQQNTPDKAFYIRAH